MIGSWGDTQKALAKDLFGRPLRVLLAAWILDREGEPFYLAEAQDAMRPFGEAGSGVRAEVESFLKHGLLSKYEDGRRNYFTPIESAMWPAFEAIVAALALGQREVGHGAKRRSNAVCRGSLSP